MIGPILIAILLPGNRTYNILSSWNFVIALGCALLMAGLIGARAFSKYIQTFALAVVLAIFQMVQLANIYYFAFLAHPSQKMELSLMRGVVDLIKLVKSYSPESGCKVLFWGPDDSRAVRSLESVYLYGYGRLSACDPSSFGKATLSTTELDRIRQEQVTRLVLMSHNKQELEIAQTKVDDCKIKTVTLVDKTICADAGLPVYLRVLQLDRHGLPRKTETH
jgi:hypothetical protein